MSNNRVGIVVCCYHDGDYGGARFPWEYEDGTWTRKRPVCALNDNDGKTSFFCLCVWVK